MTANSPFSSFLSDIAPFFHKRLVFYADVGANRGDTWEAVCESELALNRAVLVEANPKVFARLQEAVAARGAEDRTTCLNIALSDAPGTVHLRDMNDMSTVVDPARAAGGPAGQVVEVEARRFDDLAGLFPDGHVSILKIDVEGHEAHVLRGAGTMLAAHAIDVLYVEAGVSRDHPELTYYREIEDLATAQGYRLFRIYEQTHEWIEDLPALRRFNMAFLSPVMVDRYPMALTTDLARLRTRLEREFAERREERDALKAQVSALTADRDAARAEADKSAASLKERFEEIAGLSRLVESAESGRDAARAEVETLKAKLDRAWGKFDDLGRARDQMRARHRAERETLERRIAAMRRSTSWRLTAPLRGVARLFGRGK